MTKVKIDENEEIEYIISTVNTSDEEEIVEEYIIDEDAVEEEPELFETPDGRTFIKMDQSTVVEHVCGKCAQSFTNLATLKKHISICRLKDTLGDANQPKFYNTYPKKRKLLCFCCDEEKIKAHQGDYSCPKCDLKFNTRLGRERHIFSLHAKDTEFKCELCTSACPTKGILDLHMQTHAPTKPFDCKKCGRDFTRKYHLERHLKHTPCGGDKEQNILPCAVCGKKFTRTDNLREHLRGHMGQTTKKRDFQCSYCDKSFYGSSLLNIHIRTHTGEKPFPCDICQKPFSSTGALRKHRRTHTGEKPYKCPICASSFSAKETFNRHVKIHTGDRPHKCEICSKSFIQSSQLKAHMFHHTGDNGFECRLCHRVFNRKARLVDHMKFIHEGEKPIKCPYCPKTFLNETDFRRHDKAHMGVKEFKCDVCKKECSTRAMLVTHLRVHTTEDPSICDLCNKQFIRFDCLLRHIRAVHREALFEVIVEEERKRLKFLNVPANEGEKKSDATATVGSTKEDESKSGDEEIEIDDSYVDYEDDDDDDEDDDQTMHFDETAINTDSEDVKPVLQNKLPEPEEITFMDDATLKNSISQLLNLLVDEETLSQFGWPETGVEEVLSSVIKQCGHKPADYKDCADYTTKMRENTKLLFTVVIDDDSIKSLLNNHTIDEVILRVLKMAQNK